MGSVKREIGDDELEPVSKRYQDRVIAFIDIIGFKKIVEKTVTDQAYLGSIIDAIAEIRGQFIDDPKSPFQQMVRTVLFEDDFDTQVIQVSDCIVISKLANIPGALQYLIGDVTLAIHILISHGLLCKGRIECGKVFHTDKYIIGPAYNAAYLGEEAEFVPAITLSKGLREFGTNNRSDDVQVEKHFDTFVIQHIHDNYYIDYFNDLEGYIDVFETPAEHYGKLRRIIEDEYCIATDYKIKAKYLWMIDKFNASCVVKEKKLQPIEK